MKLRHFQIGLLFVLVTMLSCPLHGDSTEMKHPVLKISKISSDQVDLTLTNASDSPIRIWQETNSWGIAHWRLLILRHQQLLIFYQENESILSLDTPSFTEIPAGGNISVSLDLKSQLWHGENDQHITFVPGDIVTVIYDVPALTEGGKLHVWHGVTAVTTTIPQ